MNEILKENKQKTRATTFTLYDNDIRMLNEIRKMKNFKYSKSYLIRALILYYYEKLKEKSQ